MSLAKVGEGGLGLSAALRDRGAVLEDIDDNWLPIRGRA